MADISSIYSTIFSFGFSADPVFMFIILMAFAAFLMFYFKLPMPLVFALGVGILLLFAPFNPIVFVFIILGVAVVGWLFFKGIFKMG